MISAHQGNRAVVRAASAASKATDFLLAFLPPAIDCVVDGNEEAACRKPCKCQFAVGAARQRVRGAPALL
jgi:hypothetical protein